MFENSPWFEDLPNEELEVCEENYRLFFETMFRRQLIWKNRFLLKKPAPWTPDPILRDYKFTNVYRELDRNSQWQINNIIRDESLDIKNLIWKMMVFRYFNNPDTFTFQVPSEHRDKEITKIRDFDFPNFKAIDASEMGSAGIPLWEDYDEDKFAMFILGVRNSGQNPFTNAYVVNSGASKNKSRDCRYLKTVIPTLHSKMDELLEVLKNAETPEDIISYLKSLPAVADFIAHEFYQDFTYIARYNERHEGFFKFDQNDFTNVGLGADIGIRLIFPNRKTNTDKKRAIYDLRDAAERVLEGISHQYQENFPFLEWSYEKGEYYIGKKCNITLHQIEMWLCEFQKYWKMMLGKGKQRSKFVPKTEIL